MVLKALTLTLFIALFLLAGMQPTLALDYVETSWPNLIRTLVRFGAVNLNDEQLIDEYSIITECDLYTAFFHDDFKWNKVRTAVREAVHNDIATYPISYHYDVKLQLDHYDFARGVFKFTDNSGLRNINTFTMYEVSGTGCGTADVTLMPRSFHVVLAAPLYMDGLPISEDEGQKLLKEMDADQNNDRKIFARLNLTIIYVAPLLKTTRRSGSSLISRFAQTPNAMPDTVRLDTRLDSIDFYEDLYMAHPIYHYQATGG